MSRKITLTSEQLYAAGQHAAQRGMTLEEYIEEFIQLLKAEEQKKKEQEK